MVLGLQYLPDITLKFEAALIILYFYNSSNLGNPNNVHHPPHKYQIDNFQKMKQI